MSPAGASAQQASKAPDVTLPAETDITDPAAISDAPA